MGFLNILKIILNDHYSPEGLKLRAKELKDSPYKLCIELAAIQLENKVITRAEAKKAIEYIRTGNDELLSVGIQMLKPSKAQSDEILGLLKSGIIKAPSKY